MLKTTKKMTNRARRPMTFSVMTSTNASKTVPSTQDRKHGENRDERTASTKWTFVPVTEVSNEWLEQQPKEGVSGKDDWPAP
jgi:hypothetical protein